MPLILIDTNLLVLLAVGLASRKYISRHKRLSAFDEADFDIVYTHMNRSDGLLFCPNVLSEASNLLSYGEGPIHNEIAGSLSRMIAKFDEQYLTSAAATKDDAYTSLGITDAVLLTLARTGATLWTTDLELYLEAARRGLPAVNYNHIRETERGI